MVTRLIFVSCGQLTEEERTLGRLIKAEIDATGGYEGYFADIVQDFTGLADHILDALRRSTGAVVVLHPRGRVVSDQGKELGVRSSVWINQEIAVLAYRQFFETIKIPILAFKHDSVTLEGAMTALIINPKPLGSDEAIVSEVRSWLQADASRGRPSEQIVFDEKWGTLKVDDRRILAALIDEGGHDVKDLSVRRRLTERYGINRNRATILVRQRRTVLSALNLIQLQLNTSCQLQLRPGLDRWLRWKR